VIDCHPKRTDLPKGATGGIECRSDDVAVARLAFYVFDGSGEMVDAYLSRMAAEGIARDSHVDCRDGAGERGYIPGESDYRAGCFVNAEGYANYRATARDRVYVAILGRSADMTALEEFAWRGSQGTPALPTIWTDPGW
jgi:hypothetical protein